MVGGRARAKISHITKVPAGSLLREAKRLVKFIRVAAGSTTSSLQLLTRRLRPLHQRHNAGAALAPVVVISCFYAPIKSPICFNKLKHGRDEAGRAAERRLFFDASSQCAWFLRFCCLFVLSMFSSSLLISHASGPSRLDARRTNENGMNAITSRHCRLFCERYYLSVFARVITVVVVVIGYFLSLPPSFTPLLALSARRFLSRLTIISTMLAEQRLRPSGSDARRYLRADKSRSRVYALSKFEGGFKKRDMRDNTVPSSPADASLIIRNNGATLRRDEKPRTTRDILRKSCTRTLSLNPTSCKIIFKL